MQDLTTQQLPNQSPILWCTRRVQIQNSMYRCRANLAHVRQSAPDSGPGFRVKVLTTFEVVPSLLGSGFGIQCTSPSHTHAHAHSHTLTHSLTLSHTHSCTLSHTLSHTLPQSGWRTILKLTDLVLQCTSVNLRAKRGMFSPGRCPR